MADSDMTRLEEWMGASRYARKRALAASLARIRRLDGAIRAWVEVRPQPHRDKGRLSGIPFGVKDVIETRHLVTEYGSPIYRGRHGLADAAIVRQLRARGAVLLGKTTTAAFAFRTPAATRNPRNPRYTPGGSSSGSAAAVAAGMVPLAVGTQTLGSVLRPASYCGVTGFKPTYGLLSMEGVLPFARSLDTLGLFTDTPTGMLSVWEALGQLRDSPEELTFGVLEPITGVQPAMARAVQRAVSLMRNCGYPVKPVKLAPMLALLARESQIVMYYEGARFHRARVVQYGERLRDLAELVTVGLRISGRRYAEARRRIALSRERMVEYFATVPVIVSPAATGPAPRGLASTGDPRMNSPWTALGTPAVSIPMPTGSHLPLGLQLTAAPGQDARLLRAAVVVSGLFNRV